jgi:hypothetical protein
MLFHDAQRLVAAFDNLRIAVAADKTPQVAEAHYFFIVYDEDAGSVSHVITSHFSLTYGVAMNVPERARTNVRAI